MKHLRKKLVCCVRCVQDGRRQRQHKRALAYMTSHAHHTVQPCPPLTLLAVCQQLSCVGDVLPQPAVVAAIQLHYLLHHALLVGVTLACRREDA